MTTKRFMMAAASGVAAELLGSSKVRRCRVFVLTLALCGSVSGQTTATVAHAPRALMLVPVVRGLIPAP